MLDNTSRSFICPRYPVPTVPYAGGDAANAGRRVVLGPNFTRPARQFGRSYQDALVLLREHGPPDLWTPVTVVIGETTRDEIREYVRGRYVSAREATDRLLGPNAEQP